MRLFRPCIFLPLVYPGAVFRIRTSEKVLFLTFDDGPDPESTPLLLDILDGMDVKALFFCSGRAAEKHKSLVHELIRRGHSAGNHGYGHLKGCNTPVKEYCENAIMAAKYTSSTLFRPPYGKICLSQYRRLKKSFRIIFWDIMPYDFDTSFGAERSLRVLNRKIRPGSVIVLHDTSTSTCKYFLREFIETSVSKGYRFEVIV